ncbi:MAG TPA: phosphoribosyltransferase family protein [Candidatus Saccharimonadales bacterium]|nr:phosphoribosyltransferase family protein [Candidatus Saccharimonadales bacterium]
MAKELVGRLKFSGAQAASERMARCMLPLLESGRYLIMPVPTATSRVRSRGYDQAGLLARELSRQARLPYVDGLIRSGHTHQVGASRERRQQQLRDAFRVRAPHKIRGKHILLVDDVVTTGATLEAAGRALQAAGAARVDAAVFCAA